MKVKFTIPGIPIPKARPRVVKGHTYTPKKTKDYETLVKDVYALTVGEYLGDSAIVATIDLYFPIPESYSKSKKQRIAAGEIKHTKRPDVDNCANGREIGKWVKKAYEEARGGFPIVLLIPARTDTSYFHEYIYGKEEIRFIRGRLRFTDEGGNSTNSAPFPSMVVIYNGK